MDRTRPALLITFSLPPKRIHDYNRHGTSNRVAVLDVWAGQVISKINAIQFIREIDRSAPYLKARLIMDDFGVNKTEGKTECCRLWLPGVSITHQ